MSKSAVGIIPSCVIGTGTTASNVLNARAHYGDAAAISIQSPAALDAGTYSIKVSQDGVTYADYQEGATLANVPVPAAGKATTYLGLVAYKYFYIAGPSAASPRTFLMTKHYTA